MIYFAIFCVIFESSRLTSNVQFFDELHGKPFKTILRRRKVHFDGKMTFSDEPPGTSQIPYRPAQRARLKGKQTSWGPATLLLFLFRKKGVCSCIPS